MTVPCPSRPQPSAEQGTRQRRGMPRLRRLVAVALASVAVVPAVALTAQPAHADMRAGYYAVTPNSGSTVTGATFGFAATLALLPMPLIGDYVRVNWGDGSPQEDLRWDKCHRVDGTDGVGPDGCSITIPSSKGPVPIPFGANFVRSSHTYSLPGTYKATLTDRVLGVNYPVSWTVQSPGVPTPLYVPNDPKLNIGLDPAPLRDDGPALFFGKTFRKVWYYPDTRVRISSDSADVAPDSWTTWGCSDRCLAGYIDTSEWTRPVPDQGDHMPYITVTVPRDWRSQTDYSEAYEARAFEVTTTSNLLTNGGFEKPALAANSWATFPGLTNAVPDWYSYQDIEVQNTDGAAGGRQFVELATDRPTTLGSAQTLTWGARYRLTFQYSGRPGFGLDDNAMRLAMRTGPDGVYYYDFADNGQGRTANRWQTWTTDFTAADTQATLAFSDTGRRADGIGMLLDNVRLTRIG